MSELGIVLLLLLVFGFFVDYLLLIHSIPPSYEHAEKAGGEAGGERREERVME